MKACGAKLSVISGKQEKLQLDFGFGDIVTPKAHRMTYPTILDADNRS